MGISSSDVRGAHYVRHHFSGQGPRVRHAEIANHAVLQSVWCARPHCGLPRAWQAYRLSIAFGFDRGGHGTKGTVASATALSILLQEGIGDTIRVSLTPQPGESRTQEVVIASEILQSLGMRIFVPSVTACPGCGRTTSSTFQELAKQIDDFLRAQMPVWRHRYPGVENLKLAVMGCIVNGPGESKHADIGISLPGTGEAPAAPVFIDGEKKLTLRGDNIAQEFQQIVEQYIEKRFGEAVLAK